MPRPHQPDQSAFRSILPEEIKWQPFPAFPPEARLAVMVGHPAEAGPYVVRVKVPGGTKLMPHKHPEDRIYTVMSGVFYIGLDRSWRKIRGRQGEGLSAGQRHRSARRNLALPLGEVRRIRYAGLGNRAARPRISRRARRPADAALGIDGPRLQDFGVHVGSLRQPDIGIDPDPDMIGTYRWT